MQSITINGVNIRVNGDASIHVDRYGNVNIDVKEKIVHVPIYNKPQIPWSKKPDYWLNR